jgi:hypothetical protein
VNQLSLGCLDLENQVLQVISLGRYHEVVGLLTGRFQIYASCALHVLILNWADTNAEAAFPESQAFEALAFQILDRVELEVCQVIWVPTAASMLEAITVYKVKLRCVAIENRNARSGNRHLRDRDVLNLDRVGDPKTSPASIEAPPNIEVSLLVSAGAEAPCINLFNINTFKGLNLLKLVLLRNKSRIATKLAHFVISRSEHTTIRGQEKGMRFSAGYRKYILINYKFWTQLLQLCAWGHP